MRGFIQHLPFLGRETAESSGLNCPVSGIGRHGTQALDRIAHRVLAVRTQVAKLRIERQELLLLLSGQVFPGLHALQNLLLAFHRQGVEMLQPLLQLLLTLWRQAAECRVVLKCALLLIKRLLAMLIEPLSRVMTFRRHLIGSCGLAAFGRRLRVVQGLRPARRPAGLNSRRRRTGPWRGVSTPVRLSMGGMLGKTRHCRQYQRQAEPNVRVPDFVCCFHPCVPGPVLLGRVFASLASYWLAFTSFWTCRSSSKSESA